MSLVLFSRHESFPTYTCVTIVRWKHGFEEDGFNCLSAGLQDGK